MRLARLRYTTNTVLGPGTFKAIQIGFIVPVFGKQLTSLKLWPRLTRGCTDISNVVDQNMRRCYVLCALHNYLLATDH